ncbi:MAG: hypothetical protein F6K19_31000 [Cyanothece sp. SIO1E1]|nr:hypothetical protein [Cyanothece sp. SIO1E1]
MAVLGTSAQRSIEQIVNCILCERRMTRADQHRFMSVLLSKQWISQEDKIQVERVFDALRRGRLKVVD